MRGQVTISGASGYFKTVEVNGQNAKGGSVVLPEGEVIILKVDAELPDDYGWTDQGVIAARASNGEYAHKPFDGKGPEWAVELALGEMKAEGVDITLKLFGNKDSSARWDWNVFD